MSHRITYSIFTNPSGRQNPAEYREGEIASFKITRDSITGISRIIFTTKATFNKISISLSAHTENSNLQKGAIHCHYKSKDID